MTVLCDMQRLQTAVLPRDENGDTKFNVLICFEYSYSGNKCVCVCVCVCLCYLPASPRPFPEALATTFWRSTRRNTMITMQFRNDFCVVVMEVIERFPSLQL